MISLSVQNLSFFYGERCALRDASFQLEKGTFCALLGPNGAGKSTLFSLLARLVVPRTGTIGIAGHDLNTVPYKALARMGMVFQKPTLDLDVSVWVNMTYFAALHGLSGKQSARQIDAALDRLRMSERKNEKVRDLNGGHRRRMEIARALVHAPEVLLLDEPTVGLDAHARAAITDHVHDLGLDGTTILWATHLVDEVRSTDRLLILRGGHLLRDCKAGELDPSRTLKEVYMELTAEGEYAQ